MQKPTKQKTTKKSLGWKQSISSLPGGSNSESIVVDLKSPVVNLESDLDVSGSEDENEIQSESESENENENGNDNESETEVEETFATENVLDYIVPILEENKDEKTKVTFKTFFFLLFLSSDDKCF